MIISSENAARITSGGTLDQNDLDSILMQVNIDIIVAANAGWNNVRLDRRGADENTWWEALTALRGKGYTLSRDGDVQIVSW